VIQTNQIRKWDKTSYQNNNRYFMIISKVDSNVLNEDVSVIKIRYLDDNWVETHYARSLSLHSIVISEGNADD